ncbi:hypothetical protein H920_17225 [Fukomys damarensis]|uniref:Uncharacterized protein n=1 Tax=Fukomys damarensis TaxID=885580 RepID=A0A091DEV2_FUKDA|nr:hypothetical protein H920_17225 [Fukomys damarensis]
MPPDPLCSAQRLRPAKATTTRNPVEDRTVDTLPAPQCPSALNLPNHKDDLAMPVPPQETSGAFAPCMGLEGFAILSSLRGLPVCMRTLVILWDREQVAFICNCVFLSLHSHGDAQRTFPRDRLDPKILDRASP